MPTLFLVQSGKDVLLASASDGSSTPISASLNANSVILVSGIPVGLN